ncbi:MAG: hypothetical protein O2894_08220 [Planctomycetota bacterium]|nr:hypothetical protein [Planctomycetota bacterium]
MTQREAPTRGEGFIAYLLSALTTLLWVGCVLPAGETLASVSSPDAATPVHRDAVLIVPALLLLIVVPVGSTLALRRHGVRAVLAGMDAFVVLYVAVALLGYRLVGDGPALVFLITLFALGGLGLLEVARHTIPDGERGEQSALSGARLALALLVLVLPLHVVMHPQVERASLLGPFLFVAVSAAGSRMARDMRGLRRTTAILQLLVAVHLLITLRYTLFRTDPAIESLYWTGKTTLALAGAVVLVALIQLLMYVRSGPTVVESATTDVPGAKMAGS